MASPRSSSRAQASRLGAKIRLLRRQEGLSQVQLAERLGVSPSYLNLIEANKRPLTAPVLLRLAQSFQLDLRALAPDEDLRLGEDLLEAFGDPLFADQDLLASEVRELPTSSPGLARAVFRLYQAYRTAQQGLAALSERLSDGQGFRGEDPRIGLGKGPGPLDAGLLGVGHGFTVLDEVKN